MIERIHLEIIYALVKEGSLTKAADKLSLTQPALTHSIKKLEGIAGCKLWYKEGRNLKLTGYGHYLYKRAKKILPQFLELESHLDGLIAGRKGKLRICVECNPCYELIVGVIGDFLKSWTLVDISVTGSYKFNGIEAILNRSVDLIISPDKYDHPSLIYYPIIDFNVLLVVNNDHILSTTKVVTPQDLSDQTIYTYPVDLQRLDIFTDFLIPDGVRPKKHITVETTDIIMQLVASGRGISYFPEWMIERYNKLYGIKALKMGERGVSKTLYIAIRREDKDILYIKDFILRCKNSI